ncbi:MAG: hormogonium polysaccharide biosynthesis protein HpsA [Cyanobacteria bacterium J06626_4]
MSLDRHNSRKSRPVQPLKRFMQSLFRQLMQLSGRRSAQAGFVFPTTLLLILMVLLTVSALTFRTFSRSTQVISQRDQQVIYNAATPAVDRAKAKLEFLFLEDDRFPGAPPVGDFMANMMLPLADRVPNVAGSNLDLLGGLADPYSLPDETRLDINDDGRLDNAWSFPADVNANGTIETGEMAVYSILVDHEVRDNAGNVVANLSSVADNTKADNLVTRTGPLATTQAIGPCPSQSVVEEGWQVVDGQGTSDIQKNFQITAFVTNNSDSVNQTFESLELQQSRVSSRANKWGAWFRTDLEVFTGSDFKWNGAMHTDGNLIVGDAMVSYMLTSQNSCLYDDRASEITLGEFQYDDGTTFQGQAVKGSIRNNTNGGTDVEFHLFDGNGNPPTAGTTLGNGTDSVDGGAPAEIAVNPIILFLQDRVEHVDQSTWTRDADWADSDFVTTGRIVNDPAARPFVDDFFRADNRWGPKPRYDNNDDDLSLNKGTYGDPTDDDDVGDEITAINRLTDPVDGLDGYWERQAVRSGLRLIVDQRLELGNANGWGYDPSGITIAAADGDPLYAPTETNQTLIVNNTTRNRIGKGVHEYRQQTALRDSLAAVQGMVIYHYDIDSGEFPAACMTLTAHPGTNQSVINSRTFSNYPNTGVLKTDFLTGTGTNGWEFQFPTAFDDDSKFGTQLATTQSLGKAMRNLAYFAGDPNGGAPSFPPVQDAFAHPYPNMSMWGDYSMLRRILDGLDTGGYTTAKYDALSFADKATLHGAACTLSLLGYNLNTLEAEFNAITTAQWGELATALLARVGLAADQVDPAVGTADITPPDTWIRLANDAAGVDPVELAKVELMRIAAARWQVLRDRTFGFATGQGLVSGLANTVGLYTPASGEFALAADALPFLAGTYSVSCDPNFFAANGAPNPEDALTLALALCPKTANADPAINAEKAVKYPSLFYLFPVVDHDHDGSAALGNQQPDGNDPGLGGGLDPAIQAAEEYVADTDNYLDDPATGVNRAVTYSLLTVGDVAATPGAPGLGDWVLPAATNASPLADPDVTTEAFRITVPGGTSGIDVPFLDKGMFNGREQLPVRVLDIDIKALTTQTTGVGNNDYWLPARPDDPLVATDFATEGIVYAFREDAVREDEINRPANGSASNCAGRTGGNFRIVSQITCRMRVEPGAATPVIQDPPLQANNVNIKPVDFVPDPDRRPYGFRFKTSDGTPADFSGGDPVNGRQVGMTFVTDNTTYIQGDFNLHSSDGTTANFLEEFTDTIQGTNFGFAEFYDGRTAAELDLDNFADFSVDHWRPVEILTDALNIVSGDFLDGAIEDAFINAGNTTDSSYASLNRPLSGNTWLREDPNDPDSPIWVDRNGTFYIDDGTGTWEEYYDELTANGDHIRVDSTTTRRANLVQANETFVNAVFVSGVVPSRTQQYNGGLHNYPRLLESWRDPNTALNIGGSFIQLNFSTSATGPFDQDSWESDDTPTGDEYIEYYRNPLRNWGFDVGLLYNSPAPAARRFNDVGRERNEYYREVAADDPYVTNLRCAEDATGNRIMPNFCPNP